MRLLSIAMVVTATIFLTHKWLSSMPEHNRALAGAALTLAIAGVSFVVW